jgi:hypothetical protein
MGEISERPAEAIESLASSGLFSPANARVTRNFGHVRRKINERQDRRGGKNAGR